MNGECAICGAITERTEAEFCFICDDLLDICKNCMGQHLTESHTQAEFEKAKAELLA